MLVHDRRGAGPPLVLLHGIGSRRGVWDPVVPLLAREREVVAVDLPGFGASPPLPPGTAPTIEALADAVAAFFADAGLARPHVAGNSMGGAIALELARRGAVASAAALSPGGFWNGPERLYGVALLRLSALTARRARPLLTRAVGSPVGRALVLGHMVARPWRVDPAAARADVVQLADAPGWDATLRHVSRHAFGDGAFATAALADVPVTIGWGTRDRLLLPTQARRARRALPRARHVPLPGCGHLPMHDDPDGVAALLLAASAG